MAYGVSQAYLTKLYSGSIRRRIRGTVGNIPFTEDNILAGSFMYSDKCVNSSDINLGGVFIGQFKCTFIPSFVTNIQRGSWRGRVITFTIDLLVDAANDIWESVPCKPYKIDEANHSKSGVAVTAYDAMYSFDRPFNMDTTAGSVYDFLAFACQTCGVVLGMTQAQTEALPNGTETLALYLSNDVDTWRDFISWIAVTVGGFATINREGKLELRVWHQTPDVTIDVDDRFTGGSWSDFSTYYTGLSIVNMETEETWYYSVDPDTGLTMKLGNNPLMQYGINETIQRQRMAVLTALQEFNYVPFSSTSFIDPFIDLGDVVSYINGLAGGSGGSLGCVHSLQFDYNKGMKLIGYGKNPALFGAQSKTNKNMSGLLSRQDEAMIVTHTYTNSSKIELGDGTPTSIVRMRFATISAKVIKLLTSIQLDTEADPQGDGIVTATSYYYLNGSLLSHSPMASWNNDGTHIIPLLYWLQNLEGGRAYTWEVALEVDGGTATINADWIHAIMEAQGLVAEEEWGGALECEDTYTPLVLGHDLTTITDTVTALGTQSPQYITVTDIVGTIVLGHDIGTITDAMVDIDLTAITTNLIAEGGDNLLTEVGNNLVTEGT